MVRYRQANKADGSQHKPVYLSRNLAPVPPAGLECLPECPLEGRNDPKTAAKLAGALLSNSQPGKTRVHSAKARSEQTSYNRSADSGKCDKVRRATRWCGTPKSEDACSEILPIAGLAEEKFGRRESIL